MRFLRGKIRLHQNKLAILVILGLSMTLLGISGCRTAIEPAPELPPTPGAPPGGQVTESPLPEADGAAVYEYIIKTDNYKEWQMWPGLSARYAGRGAAHGPILTTYVSDSVRAALDGEGNIPDDGIIVKENYNEANELQALTVMYKVPGYDSQHNDWFWGYYRADGSIIDEGKIDMCISCHDMAKNRPYVWNDSPAVMLISSPQEGSELQPGNIGVSVNVFNFRVVDKLGESPVPGEGHIHYYMDADIPTTPGQPAVSAPGTYKAAPGTSITWENVAPGTHTFGVQLVNNNHTPFDPSVTATITVTVGSAPPPAEPTAEPRAEQLKLSTKEGLGQYLTDATGMTLYLFKNDYANQSNWSGPAWPTFYVQDVVAPAGFNQADFGTITRSDGDLQTTYKGWPLYYYIGDVAPGDTNGQGLNNAWFVVGEDTGTAPQAPSQAPSNGGIYGY